MRRRPDHLRVIDGGKVSFQAETKPVRGHLPSAADTLAQAKAIATGVTIGGTFIRFSPKLRERLARIAAEAGSRRALT
jgi:hypothetical protein